MQGKLIQSLINLFPPPSQDVIIKCVFIIGFDKLIKKGYIGNGNVKIHEITQYAGNQYSSICIIDKVQSCGRIFQIQEPYHLRHEVELLKEEIVKLTQQVHCAQVHSTPTDTRKRSASVGFRQNKNSTSGTNNAKKEKREITPKITETIPQTVNHIQINIQKHHLDDTEIKSIMRENNVDKPPKPQKRYTYSDECPVQVEFEDTDRYPVKDAQQQLQYSQLQQSASSNNNYNTNQTFAQPQSSQKQQLVQSKSMHIQSTNTYHKSPKLKYQSVKSQKDSRKAKNLEIVQEESSQSHKKHTSSHSAGRSSYRQGSKQATHSNVTSKIKALLDQDKKLHKQHQQEMVSERAFINPYDQPQLIQQQQLQSATSTNSKKVYSGGSFYNKPINIDYQPKSQIANNYLQGSVSMTHQASGRGKDSVTFKDGTSQFGISPPKQQGFMKKFRQYQESDLKRSEDYNRSSVSSNFSMFNPNDELKTFFQNDFLERKKYIGSSNDFNKMSSPSSSVEHSKYISASQLEDQYINNIINSSPQQYKQQQPQQQHRDYSLESNVFQNNRLSVTRILNNSQL